MAESIFTSQTPTSTDITTVNDLNLGTVFSSDVNGTVTHVRWFFPTIVPSGTVVGALWRWTDDGNGTLLAQGNFVAPVAGAWNTVAITPQAITAGTFYVASVFISNHYVASPTFFNSGSTTNIHLTAPQDNGIVPRHNGKFVEGVGSLAYPFQSFNGTCYFADVVFEPEGAGGFSPNGLPVTLTLGAPTLEDSALAVNPGGITVPITFGAPSVSGAPPPARLDPVVDMYTQLLSCLCAAVSEQPNPPLHCVPRVGTEVLYDMGQYSDQCCEGLAYIMLGDTYFSSDSFPDQDIIRQVRGNCAPPTWGQNFKVGIVRCISAGQPDGEPPTDAEWTAAAIQNLYDAQSLRQAACCFRNWVMTQYGTIYDGMSVVINRQTQANPAGGCVERYMTVAVQFPNLDCSCP